jgi:hypothetical protein
VKWDYKEIKNFVRSAIQLIVTIPPFVERGFQSSKLIPMLNHVSRTVPLIPHIFHTALKFARDNPDRIKSNIPDPLTISLLDLFFLEITAASFPRNRSRTASRKPIKSGTVPLNQIQPISTFIEVRSENFQVINFERQRTERK